MVKSQHVCWRLTHRTNSLHPKWSLFLDIIEIIREMTDAAACIHVIADTWQRKKTVTVTQPWNDLYLTPHVCCDPSLMDTSPRCSSLKCRLMPVSITAAPLMASWYFGNVCHMVQAATSQVRFWSRQLSGVVCVCVCDWCLERWNVKPTVGYLQFRNTQDLF